MLFYTFLQESLPSSFSPPAAPAPPPLILTQDEIDAPIEEESLLAEKEKIEKLVREKEEEIKEKEEEMRILKEKEEIITKSLSGKYLKCLESSSSFLL